MKEATAAAWPEFSPFGVPVRPKPPTGPLPQHAMEVDLLHRFILSLNDRVTFQMEQTGIRLKLGYLFARKCNDTFSADVFRWLICEIRFKNKLTCRTEPFMWQRMTKNLFLKPYGDDETERMPFVIHTGGEPLTVAFFTAVGRSHQHYVRIIPISSLFHN